LKPEKWTRHETIDGGRKEGRKKIEGGYFVRWKRGRKEGEKEGRKEGRKEGEGRYFIK
jgi:hypothetical protein